MKYCGLVILLLVAQCFIGMEAAGKILQDLRMWEVVKWSEPKIVKLGYIKILLNEKDPQGGGASDILHFDHRPFLGCWPLDCSVFVYISKVFPLSEYNSSN